MSREAQSSASSLSPSVTLNFSGGAELLVGKVRSHSVVLPSRSDNTGWTLDGLVGWIASNLLTERPELFLKGNSVRPGILVLVNDQDWELVGQDYKIVSGDEITFISTLHGG
jgi:ubiquitin related modifier 1